MLCGSPAWKHTITLDIQAPWESSMETHIHTRRYTGSVGENTYIGYTSSVRVQHGNIQSHWVYKRRESPAWKHTFTQEEDMQAPALIQEDIQASWESSMEK